MSRLGLVSAGEANVSVPGGERLGLVSVSEGERLGLVSVSGGERLGLVSVSSFYVSCPSLMMHSFPKKNEIK